LKDAALIEGNIILIYYGGMTMKFLDYTVKTVDDKQYNFRNYSDKVFLIVNTASE